MGVAPHRLSGQYIGRRRQMRASFLCTSVACLTAAMIGLGAAPVTAQQSPKVVSGPGINPQCFKPWASTTKYFQWNKKNPPYRIALANGFVGNTCSTQMIKTSKAYAETPEMKPLIKELKAVSTATDAAAQATPIDNFINSRYYALT